MKKSRNIKNVALKVVEKIVRNEVKRDVVGPPYCIGIGHQPKTEAERELRFDKLR